MSNTGLFLSIIIVLALPIGWVVGAVASTRASGVRIPVQVEQDESLRSIKVHIRNR